MNTYEIMLAIRDTLDTWQFGRIGDSTAIEKIKEHLGKEQTPLSLPASSENNLFSLFKKAQEKLKYPKIVYPSETEGRYIFKLLGAKSTTPGQISITGQDGKYYAKVQKNGEIRWFNDARTPNIQSEIQTIVSDPISTAKMLGQKYSNCCFCGLELTNKNSLAVGYGPICAANYGLPWEGMAEQKEIEGLGEL